MIAHADADAFFASVLQRKDPTLKGKAILALGMGGGCVIAASYEAKAYGVKTGMTLKDARKLVPNPTEVISDFHEACVASEQLENILRNDCANVEQFSIDEWFADLGTRTGGIPKELISWATSMRHTMSTQVGITVSIGVGPTKLLAKMASEYRKPAGVTVIQKPKKEDLDIEAFLRDRPIAAIPGIGPRRENHAIVQGWKTAWDFANADTEAVIRLFGRPGEDLQRELLGERLYDVEEDHAPPKSISRCRSFRGTNDRDYIFAHLLGHLTYTIIKMRRHKLSCGRMSVWIRDGEYKHQGSDRKIPQPVETEEDIFPYLLSCFQSLYRRDNRYTQVGLVLADLRPAGIVQYSLFDGTKRKDEGESIQKSLDLLREQYGRGAVFRAPAMQLPQEKRSKNPDMYGGIRPCS